MDNLKEKEPEFIEADKKALQSVIAQAEKKAEKDYTSESWKAFAEALAKAQEVNTDDKASQEEVDNATEVLQKAMDNLKEKEPEFIEVDKKEPTKTEPVKTGDTQMPFVFGLAMAVSAAGIVVVKRRRKADK